MSLIVRSSNWLVSDDITAEEAGVWFTTGFGAEVRLEVSVLIFDEGRRDWFQTQPEFDGFEVTVCPQLREM